MEYGPNRYALLAANLSQVQHLLGRLAADQPFDLLSLLAKAVKVSSVPGMLIVVSSGLSTAGGFDLRQVGWYANPAAAARQLEREGLLPALTGWHVIFSGLGDTAGDQPALPLPQQGRTRGLHHGHLPRCGRRRPAIPMTLPAPIRPRSARTRPGRPGPGGDTVQGPHHWTGENIPADMFFRLNSSRLLPGVDSILGPLAARAVAYHLQVKITGFASPETGSSAYNKALSLARAQAIQGRLIALGVSPDQIVQVAGVGTAGQPAAACYRGGHLTRPYAQSCGASSSCSAQFPVPPSNRPTFGDPHDHPCQRKPAHLRRGSCGHPAAGPRPSRGRRA